jgi:hypothetical protein
MTERFAEGFVVLQATMRFGAAQDGVQNFLSGESERGCRGEEPESCIGVARQRGAETLPKFAIAALNAV